jgi:hypothetical protein
MIQSVALSLVALLLACGLALAQSAAPAPIPVPKEALPLSDAPKPGAPAAAAPQRDPDKKSDYEPQVGQPGKDVVWVPTPQSTVDKMLDMAGAKPGDYVIDLGSGNGITVITAAKRGIKALGIEFNPDMVALSRRNAEREGVSNLATFVEGDIFKTDFSQATVLTMYLLPRLNMALRPTILKMKPGTRVATNSFHMEDWKPDDGWSGSSGEKCLESCSAYMWIVPANVQGMWSTPAGRLKLSQKFQFFTGSLSANGKTHKITDGRVRGEAFTFTAGGRKYEGTVKGKTMTVKAG